FSATSQAPLAARQTVVDGANPSVGQVSDVPLQVSATSQVPLAARQTVPLEVAVQVPTVPGALQTPHPPLHAVLQQTPLTQNPLEHWLLEVHDKVDDAL